MNETPQFLTGHCSTELKKGLAAYPSVTLDTLKRLALDSPGNFAACRRLADGDALILTDHSGSLPIYYGVTEGKVAVDWKPREAAITLGSARIDPVSAADFILNGTVCYPYTMFKGVFVAPPGAVTTISSTGRQSHVYYEPFEVTPYGSVTEWGEKLCDGTSKALNSGLEGVKKVAVLFSGGEDARSVVSILPEGLDVELYTVSDGENREVRLARRAAKVLSYRFVFRQRPSGFYWEELERRVREIGGEFDIRHTHIFGPLAEGLELADAIVGGYGSDTLFKTIWMRNIVRSRFMPERLSPKYPNVPVGAAYSMAGVSFSSEILDAVRERRINHHEALKRIRPSSAGNWHTLWPLGTQRVAYAHYLAVRLIGPRVVEPFINSQVYRIAAEMPDAFRVDRKAFRSAFVGAMGRAAWVSTSSGRIPAVGGFLGKWAMTGITHSRKVGDRLGKWRAKRQGMPWVPQGAWNPDHDAFETNIEELLSGQDLETLRVSLEGVFAEQRQQDGFSTAVNMLPAAVRLRVAQIGLLMRDEK